MENKEVPALLEKYKAGDCNEEEKAWLETWYLQHDPKEILALQPQEMAEDLQQIGAGLPLYRQAKSGKLWPRITAAASILLLLSIGTLLHFRQPAQQIAQNRGRDIPPGSDKATITLANGKKVMITGAKEGLLASQGNTTISIQVGNAVVYKATGKETTLEYNTMTTPRGGQHALILADGTHAWLDAASSITYPVAFTGKDRPVKITGQVYFEVAHNASKPFRVSAAGQTVQVLGTHFNINAYPDEPNVKTTLFEGSIKIATNLEQTILKPGQQAQINRNKISVTSEIDLDEAIAWHKGLFQFHDADIQTVMRQLSRWYDVDVSYEGRPTDRRFSGKLYRNVSALTIADILSYKKIRFRIEGKKIIVEP